MENKSWDIISKLWEDGQSLKEKIDVYFDYWDGKYDAPANSLFKDQKKTACNVCKEITETKLASMLDAQFSIAVVPEVSIFSDIGGMQDQQAIADIYHAEVQNVLARNNWDAIKERVGRWGIVGSIGLSQTHWDDNEPGGNIKIEGIDPRNIKFDKNAKSFSDLTFIAYKMEINPSKAKQKYAKNEDGSFDEEKCKLIDRLSGTNTDYQRGQKKGVVVGKNDNNGVVDMAFARDRINTSAGKVLELIVMFLMDDSTYAPEEKDTAEETLEKQILEAKYPNGRMIIFNTNKEHKFILKDDPAPEGFRDLGNIDHFTPTDFTGLTGRSELEDIIPIQDRINGVMLKIRQLIGTQINAVCLDKGLDTEVKEGGLVNSGVLFLDGLERGQIPGILNNGSVVVAMDLLQYVEKLKQEAYDVARLNETMINGVRQTGTTSADQVEALQESPMAAIRLIQRNLKEWVINVGGKILTLIQEYYTFQRLIKITTGVNYNGTAVEFARFTQSIPNENGEKTQQIELLNKAGQAIKTINLDKNWKFKVEVVAGTEIPRSRREASQLVERLYAGGILGDPQDLDVKEQYLRALDVPNYRAFIQIQRQKQKEQEANPPRVDLQQILQDPNISKGVSDFIKSLQFNSPAREQVLEEIGLNPATDTIETAPVQSIASKADVKEVVNMSPTNASDDPVKAMDAQDISSAMFDQQHNKGVKNEIPVIG